MINRRMLFGSLSIILTSVIFIAIFTNRTSELTDFVSKDFLISNPSLHIEKVNGVELTTLDISKSSQQEILSLLLPIQLRKTNTDYNVPEADYRITSKTNRDFELYFFLEENVIVLNHSLKGYKVLDETFMEAIREQLK